MDGLRGRTLTILGFGAIGKEIAKRIKPFGVNLTPCLSIASLFKARIKSKLDRWAKIFSSDALTTEKLCPPLIREGYSS